MIAAELSPSQLASVETLDEELRDRLLRRVDWRFLLPTPAPSRSVCFADGPLRDAVGLMSGSLVQPSEGDCDLAVAVRPDLATLASARAALRPGGACYTEWPWPLVGGPAGVRRRLEAAGFSHVACYWAWPPPGGARPRFWVPLDAQGALGHFQASRPALGGVARRALVRARLAGWALAVRTGLIAPICAVARKPPLSLSDGGLLDMLQREWESWDLGPRPDRLSWQLLTGGRGSARKVVGLVYAEPHSRPRMVVKLSRVAHAANCLAREARTLRAIAARGQGRMQGLPRVLFCREQAGGAVALGQTALSGDSLYSRLRWDNYRELALKATDWLADLAGRPEPRPRADWWPRLVQPVLSEFSESPGGAVAPDFLAATTRLLDRLPTLPLVVNHGDAGPENMLVDSRGELAMVDWEDGEVDGLPLLDLVFFLTYLAFQLHDPWRTGRFREVYRATLDPTTPTGRVRAECLARYAERIGLDPAALHPLSVLQWVLRTRWEHQGLRGGADQPALEAFQRSLYLSLWQEELRHGGPAPAT